MYDVVIIGAGHNGLVAAFYLSKAGLKVLVLERRSMVGGLCATEEVYPGFRANVGANTGHQLEPRVLHDMRLEDFGLKYVENEPSAFMVWPDGRTFVGYHNQKMLAEEIEKFAPGESSRYFGFIKEMSDLGDVLDVSFFAAAPPISSLFAKLETPVQRELFMRYFFGSARDVLESHFKSQEMKAALGLVAVANNLNGPSSPGSAYNLVHRPLYRASREVREGTAFHTMGHAIKAPIGGMGAITAAMSRAVEAAGGEVQCEAGVSEVMCINGSARGVVLSAGSEVEARVVISNLNPRMTLEQLVPSAELDSGFRARLANLRMDGSVFKLVLALDAAPRFAAARDDAENEMFMRCGFRTCPTLDDMDGAYHDAAEGRWSETPMVWGLTPSAYDPTLAPEGKHVMTISAFHAPYRLAEGRSWSGEREVFAKHVINQLASEYIPNLNSILLHAHMRSPVDFESDFGLFKGNVSHGDVLAARMFDMRPLAGYSDYTTPIKGLYLCGVGTWPASNVSGLPGWNAAKKVLSDLRSSSRLVEASEDYFEVPIDGSPT